MRASSPASPRQTRPLECIGPAALKIFEIIDKLEGDIARFKDETARGGGIAKLRKSGESWDCEDITVYRREAQSYMQKVFAYAATLHFAMQRTLWNIEFIHECPPHPCDDPAASAYPWYASQGYANGGGDHDAGGELKIAVDARAAAERAARDAEAEWKVQSERATEAEAQGRQEREARWAADRALRETEARAKQAEQGRAAAERMAEEAAKDREAAQAQAAELEERMRQFERDADRAPTAAASRSRRSGRPRPRTGRQAASAAADVQTAESHS